jgi:hypothetical protein
MAEHRQSDLAEVVGLRRRDERQDPLVNPSHATSLARLGPKNRLRRFVPRIACGDSSQLARSRSVPRSAFADRRKLARRQRTKSPDGTAVLGREA